MALRTKIDNIERYLATNTTVTALDDWGTVITIGGAEDLPRYYAKNHTTGEVSTDTELIQAIETKRRTRANKGVYTPITVTWGTDEHTETDERALRALVDTGRVQMMNPGGAYGKP